MPRAPGNADISPDFEDRGLFRTYGGPVAVELIPQIVRTAPDNMIIRGFFDKTTEVAVVIAGRRVREARSLESHLQWLDNRVRQAAAKQRKPEPPIEYMRLPVQIKGSWRHQYFQDPEGNETRTYQLIAGRWAFAGHDGKLLQFGEAPACDIRTKERPKSYILSTREIDAVPHTNAKRGQPE